MVGFWQGISLAFIGAILILMLGKNNGEVTVILSISTICMIFLLAFSYMTPMISLMHRLQEMSNLDNGILKILLKAVGVGLITEIAQLICTDAGNSALGQAVQFLGCVVIFWISIPLLEKLLDLVETLMGNI